MPPSESGHFTPYYYRFSCYDDDDDVVFISTLFIFVIIEATLFKNNDCIWIIIFIISIIYKLLSNNLE